ncbi:MAG: hypothetical protein ACOH2D_05275 [Gelidibacter sp.]
MKISKILFAIVIASTLLVSSCRDTKTKATDDHGHEHDADGGHMHQENVEQEEFQVGKDSMGNKTEEHGHEHDSDGNHTNDPETHKHDDGSEHHDH